MGNRLSKIATRTGDRGETGLGDGSRVAKDSARIQALGDIDELNSALGVLLAEKLPAALREALLRIQHDLFDLGVDAELRVQAPRDGAQHARVRGQVALRERHHLAPLGRVDDAQPQLRADMQGPADPA